MKGFPPGLADIVRHLVLPGLAGSLAGVTAAAAMLVLNVGGLGALVRGTAEPMVAVALLAFGFVVTFGSAAIGVAIMSLGDDDCDDG